MFQIEWRDGKEPALWKICVGVGMFFIATAILGAVAGASDRTYHVIVTIGVVPLCVAMVDTWIDRFYELIGKERK